MGDSRRAALLMMLGTLLNLLLNPILIFGCCGLPALGVRGSALATVIAQGVSTAWLLWLLHRHRLLKARGWGLRDACRAVRSIMRFGLPGMVSTSMMPVSATVITWISGGFGHEAVAACGAAGRLEMFAFIIPMALGMSLTPFISQNYGAQRLDRIREGARLAYRFALAYGVAVAVLFFLLARPLSSLFSSDPRVVEVMVAYIRTVAFGYGLMEAHRYSGMIFTGMHRPFSATALNLTRVLALLIPLSLAGGAFLRRARRLLGQAGDGPRGRRPRPVLGAPDAAPRRRNADAVLNAAGRRMVRRRCGPFQNRPGIWRPAVTPDMRDSASFFTASSALLAATRIMS